MSFPMMSPAQVFAKVKVSEPMKLDVLQAAKVAKGARKTVPTSFHVSEVTGYEISSVYDMMTPSEFESTYKMSTKAAGVKTVQLADSFGRTGNYILLRPPVGKEQMQLKVFSRVDLDVDKAVVGSALRESQATELKQVYTKDLEKLGQFPADMVMMSKKELDDLVASKKAAEELAQATQALEAEASHDAEVEETKPEETQEDEEMEESSDDDQRLLLPSEIEKKKKEALREAKRRRGKGKGKAGNSKGPSRAPMPPLKRARLAVDDGGSVASQGSLALQKLDAKSILEGVKPGQSLHQARRTLESMQPSEAKVTLQDQYNLAALAQD